ncbi:MAG: transcription antitermination factor NusB [Oscillospiraceae bacterium]
MKKGSLIREAAFILVFEKIFRTEESCDEIIATAKDADIFDFGEESVEEKDFDKVSAAVFKGVYDNLDELDEIISSYSEKRQIGRISKVSLAVLRLAIYEIKHNDKVPTNVAVSEAVNLAKKYGFDPDVKFVNGVLGRFAESVEAKA